MFAYHIGKTDHDISLAQLGHNICILHFAESEKRDKKNGSGIGDNMKNESQEYAFEED